MNASTFTARVVASTGADVAAALSAAVGALSGPLHGGAPARVLKMIDAVEQAGDAEKWVKEALDKGERLMGFGHRVYRAEDPRAAVLRRTSREIGSERFEVAEALEKAALAELKARKPDRVLATNVEFWSAVVLDHADIPSSMFTSMFTCARTAGWAAHILEQKREARLIRPSAKYVGPGAAGALSRLTPTARCRIVAEHLRVGLGEPGDLRRRRARAPPHLVPDRLAVRGQDDGLHAPVALGGAALGQAGGLEPVDDPGHVGVVALQRAGQRAHRQRLVGLEVAERHRLLEREPELGEDGHPARLVGAEDAPEEAPRPPAAGDRWWHAAIIA